MPTYVVLASAAREIYGKSVATNDTIQLTEEQAGPLLLKLQIALSGSQTPDPPPADPVQSGDVVTLRRGLLSVQATMADVGEFAREGAVEGEGVTEIVKITQAAYDALSAKDAATLYVIPVA